MGFYNSFLRKLGWSKEDLVREGACAPRCPHLPRRLCLPRSARSLAPHRHSRGPASQPPSTTLAPVYWGQCRTFVTLVRMARQSINLARGPW